MSKVTVKKLKKKPLGQFCMSLASMVDANISVTEALKFWGEKQPNPELRNGVLGIQKDIEMGMPTHVAFKRSGLFDDIFVSLIKAGVSSGSLSQALRAITHRLRTEMNFESKLKKVIYTPVAVIGILGAIFIASQLLIVPDVEKMITDVGQEPDAFSAAIFKVSHIVAKTWFIVVPILLTVFATIFFVKPVQQSIITTLGLKWRLLRNLVNGFQQMTFLGAMKMLYENNISLTETLQVASEVMQHNKFNKELLKVKKMTQNGMPLDTCFQNFTSCDAEVTHLIAIGVKTSTLAEQLHRLATLYEEETEEIIDTFTGVIKIALLFTALCLIGFVFIGAYLPVVLMGPKMMNSAG